METTHAGHAAVDTRQTRTPARAPTPATTAPNLNLLRLHRRAGNQSVTSLISRLVQRCGPVPCNCSGRLEFRSLYSAAHRAHKAGAWQPDDLWYRDNTMKNAAPLFGMTIPPAVPSAESKARIAGVYARLAQLRFRVTGGAVHFDLGSATTWESGPGSHVTLSATFFAKSPADQVWLLLDRVVGAASFVESARKPAFVSIIKKMGARFGGP